MATADVADLMQAKPIIIGRTNADHAEAAER
jgi:hypothetical protein